MQVTDGMVNNFCQTILQAIRCNMDIKFIGSGDAAKAALYYITDYVTKSQLTTQVAYGTLLGAVRKLQQETSSIDMSPPAQAKRLLIKCANSLISKQELSAAQVASYVMGYGDSYKSHTFRNLYWPSFERYIEHSLPLQQNVDIDSSTSDLPLLIENEALQDDEVIIEHNGSSLVPQGSDVMDYIARGASPEFDDLCVWDFVALTEKERIDLNNNNLLLQPSPSRGRPRNTRALFLSNHPQSTSHQLRLRTEKLTPVPIGPKIYRRDVDSKYEQYCRLMLILFKPWRSPTDLKSTNITWADTFHEYKTSLSSHHLRIIDNIQKLHECKDKRDAHYAARQSRLKSTHNQPSNTGIYNDNIDQNTVDILDILYDGDRSRSNLRNKENKDALDAVTAAEKGGLFLDNIIHEFSTTTSQYTTPFSSQIVDTSLEEIWRNTYKERRETQRDSMRNIDNPPTPSNNTSPINDTLMIQHIGTVKEHTNGNLSINVDPYENKDQTRDTIQEIIDTFTLNTEQAHAFQIIAEHARNKNQNDFRMFIGGAGGTGKSRVIDALTAYFASQHQTRRLRLTAFTGVAAQNIRGMTLHSALNLNQLEKMSISNGSNARRQLIENWQGVDYLFIDEVSMVGCELLADISKALSIAKECTKPFGGICVVFAGDFCQLPPVAYTPLYSALNALTKTAADSLNDRGQKKIKGLLLWQSLDYVILLTQSMRQSGPENEVFRNLLSKVRYGICTQENIALLNSRILGRAQVDTTIGDWNTAPIITRSNAVKDALNSRAVQAFANRLARPIEMYWAHDYKDRGREKIDAGALYDYLINLHSGRTHHTMGCLPLVHGMPVMIGENYDVSGGIVNGSEGILKSVRFTIDNDGKRHATSCVVTVTKSSGLPLPHLEPFDVVVLEESINFSIKHPITGRLTVFRRKQLPLLPAFALTDYKAQGKTLPKIIVDLQSCTNISSAYVMLSRATSLDGLLVLRPFDPKKLRSHASGDFRTEMRRLDILACHTILSSNNYECHENAQHSLDRLLAQHHTTLTDANTVHTFSLSDDENNNLSDDETSLDNIAQHHTTPTNANTIHTFSLSDDENDNLNNDNTSLNDT